MGGYTKPELLLFCFGLQSVEFFHKLFLLFLYAFGEELLLLFHQTILVLYILLEGFEGVS